MFHELLSASALNLATVNVSEQASILPWIIGLVGFVGFISTIKAIGRINSESTCLGEIICKEEDAIIKAENLDKESHVTRRLKAMNGEVSAEKTPDLRHLHLLTQKEEAGRPSNRISAWCTSSLLIMGIGMTIFNLYNEQENIKTSLVESLPQMLIPSGVAIIATLILLLFRAIYVSKANNFLAELDYQTMVKFLKIFKAPNPVESSLNGLAARLFQIDNLLNDFRKSLDSLTTGVGAMANNTKHIENASTALVELKASFDRTCTSLTKITELHSSEHNNAIKASQKMIEEVEKHTDMWNSARQSYVQQKDATQELVQQIETLEKNIEVQKEILTETGTSLAATTETLTQTSRQLTEETQKQIDYWNNAQTSYNKQLATSANITEKIEILEKNIEVQKEILTETGTSLAATTETLTQTSRQLTEETQKQIDYWNNAQTIRESSNKLYETDTRLNTNLTVSKQYGNIFKNHSQYH